MANNRDIERFLNKVSKKRTGCWIWTAGKKGGGYGVFYLNGRSRGAHRVALYLFKGLDLDTPLDAMHSCDTPSCVNPNHLKYGSRAENMVDASVKGRIVRVQDWRGELNPKSRISPSQREEIILAVQAGGTRKEVAKLFGVSSVRVGQIMKDAGLPSELSGSEAARLARLSRKHCKRGHQLSGDNVKVNSAGARICIKCEKHNAEARKARRRAREN